ncbi:hypothetical protein BH23GEM1_BH23GEM1_00600 [soil metagenome]
MLKPLRSPSISDNEILQKPWRHNNRIRHKKGRLWKLELPPRFDGHPDSFA